MKTHYQALQVAPTATADQIEAAYQKAVAKLKQAKGMPGSEIARRTKELEDAWAVLSDPARRQAYDAQQGIKSVVTTVAASSAAAAPKAAKATAAQKAGATPKRVSGVLAKLFPWLNSPHMFATLGVLVAFAVLSVFFFRPLFSGKQLSQNDLALAKGMQKNVVDYRDAHNGEDPYWTMNAFSGMPSYPVGSKYEGNILFQVDQIARFGLGYPTGYVLLGLILMFALLRLHRVNIGFAAAGAVAFAFFSYFTIIIEAGHSNKFISLMYAPLLFIAIKQAFDGKFAKAALLTFLGVGLEIFSNHVQMTFYIGILVLCYGVYYLVQLIRDGKLRQGIIAIVVLGIFSGLGFAINANRMLPLNEYVKYSIRGPSELSTASVEAKSGGLDKDYAFSYSLGRDEALTLLIPHYKGGGTLTEMPAGGKYFEFLKQQGVPESEIKKYAAPARVVGMAPYWGHLDFTSGPIYVGAIICFLFVLGLILVKSPVKWALVYATMIALLIGMGDTSFGVLSAMILLALPLVYILTASKIKGLSPLAYGAVLTAGGLVAAVALDGGYTFTDLLFDYLPLYNKFRAPSSVLVVVAISIPWLAVMGAQAVLDDKTDNKKRLQALYVAAGVVGGLTLVLGLFGSGIFDFRTAEEVANYAKAKPEEKQIMEIIFQDRALMLRNDALRSFGFIAAAAVVLWLAVRGMGNMKPGLVGAIIALLVVVDLFGVDFRYLNEESYVPKTDYEAQFAPRPADEFIKRDTGYYRVFAIARNPFNESFTAYHFPSIGGYNAAKIRRYQQVIEKHFMGNLSLNVLLMLNARYCIVQPGQSLPGYGRVFPGEGQDPKTQQENVLYNPSTYGPAWITQEVKVVPTPDAALDSIGKVISYITAVVEEKDKAKLGQFSTDTVDVTQEKVALKARSNTRMVYSYSSPKARFVTFSEIYYPAGWTATIDGKEAEILQTNFILRGLVVPAGQHTIAFTYAPQSVATGRTLSTIGSVLLVLTALGAVFVALRPKDENADQAA